MLKFLIKNSFFFFLCLAIVCSGFACSRNDPNSNSFVIKESTSPLQNNLNNPNNINTVAEIKASSKAEMNINIVDKDHLITNTQIGKIRLGMSIRDIKKLYPGNTLKIVAGTLDSASSDIEVQQNGEKLFYFATENFDDAETEELPDETDKIDFLMTNNPNFSTVEGIKVGQTFGDAEKVYGKPKFYNDPVYDFIVFDNPAIKTAAFYHVYRAQTEASKNFSPEAKITHIGIGKM